MSSLHGPFNELHSSDTTMGEQHPPHCLCGIIHHPPAAPQLYQSITGDWLYDGRKRSSSVTNDWTYMTKCIYLYQHLERGLYQIRRFWDNPARNQETLRPLPPRRNYTILRRWMFRVNFIGIPLLSQCGRCTRPAPCVECRSSGCSSPPRGLEDSRTSPGASARRVASPARRY